jgi:hypothetical protein
MAQVLAEIRRIAVAALDWVFWAILWVWNKTAGQITQALTSDFVRLPDWKALLYALLVVLIAYLLWSTVPVILRAILQIFLAIWGAIKTIIEVLFANIWVLAAAFVTALVINSFKWGPIVGRMPWQ